MARLPNSQSTALISQRDTVSAGLPPDAQPKSVVYEYPWEYFAVKNGEWEKLTKAEQTLGATVFKALHPNETIPRSGKEVVGTKPDTLLIHRGKPVAHHRIVKKESKKKYMSTMSVLSVIEGFVALLDEDAKFKLLTKLATELGMEIE